MQESNKANPVHLSDVRKSVFTILGKNQRKQNIFAGIDFRPTAPQHASGNSLLLSVDGIEIEGEILQSNKSTPDNGSSHQRKSQRARDAKRVSVKRTSSQAVVSKYCSAASRPDFGSIHDGQANEVTSVESLDPFGIDEKQHSCPVDDECHPNRYRLETERIATTEMHKKTGRRLLDEVAPTHPNHNRPSLLEANSHHNSSEQSLDLFDLTDHKTKKKEEKGKKGITNRRVVLKGAKKSTGGRVMIDTAVTKRAIELEEIGHIGSSSDLDVSFDENDNKRNTKTSESYNNTYREEEMSHFEQEEADSYYSSDDDDDDASHGDVSEFEDCDRQSPPRDAKKFILPNKLASSSPMRVGRAPSRISVARPNYNCDSHPQRNINKSSMISNNRPTAANSHFLSLVDHGNWRVLGKEANRIHRQTFKQRQTKEYSYSDSSDGEDSTSSSSSERDSDYRKDNKNETRKDLHASHSSFYNSVLSFFSEHSAADIWSSDDDDESVIARQVETKGEWHRSVARLSSGQLRRWDGFRPRVMELMEKAMVDNLGNVEELQHQFAGREAELIYTLEQMVERAQKPKRFVVHKSRNQFREKNVYRPKAHGSTEAVAFIAAACTIDEGLHIKPEFWKDGENSVYTLHTSNFFDEDNESDSDSEEESDEGSDFQEEEDSYYSDESSDDDSESQVSEESGCKETSESSSWNYETNDDHSDDADWGLTREARSGYQE